MPEDEDLDPTPVFAGDSVLPEITVQPTEELEAPRDLRLRPLLAVVAVLVVAAAVVWWIVNRSPGGTLPEPAVVVEDIPAFEHPVEAAEEQEEAPAGKPLEVTEAAPESPRIQETAGPATRVLEVAARGAADETVVTVRANGNLSVESVMISRLKDPARVWVRIQGIETFYRPNDIEVGTPEVERVRVGHHPEETPQSLYVVLDLEDSAAVVREHTIKGDTLRVVVGRP
jgi:cytoskeletal protein RodZ